MWTTCKPQCLPAVAHLDYKEAIFNFNFTWNRFDFFYFLLLNIILQVLLRDRSAPKTFRESHFLPEHLPALTHMGGSRSTVRQRVRQIMSPCCAHRMHASFWKLQKARTWSDPPGCTAHLLWLCADSATYQGAFCPRQGGVGCKCARPKSLKMQ